MINPQKNSDISKEMLNILIIDDSEEDFILIKSALRKGGLNVKTKKISTEETFKNSLTESNWDVILCDYYMPAFSAEEAIKIWKHQDIEIPFIIVSGAIGEIEAVSLLKNGAHDFILKDNLARLVPAIERELEQVEEHKKKKAIEKALIESEEQYRSLFNDALDMIHLVDPNGKIIDANPIELKKMKYTREEYIGKHLLDILHPNYHEIAEQKLKHIFSGKNIINNLEVVHVAKDGTEINVEVNIFPRYENGKVKYIRSIMRDLTDRKKNEEALAQERHNADMYLQMAGVMFIGLDLKGKIVLANPKAREILDCFENDIIGLDWFENFIPENEREGIKNVFHKVTRGELESTNYHENLIISKSKQKKLIAWNNSLLYGKSGEITGVISSGEDITIRRKLEAELLKSQKLETIGTLAGGIAHDFNNILSPIIGMSTMLLEEFPKDSEAYENMETIVKAGMRGRDLVKQILSFSRQYEAELQPIRIQTILDECYKLIRATIPANFEITRDIQRDCRLILADPGKIHQVAMNLLTNAYQSIEPTGGKIAIQLKEDNLLEQDLKGMSLLPGWYIIMTISDTGSGIDPAIIEKIFYPYFTKKVQGKGTGLGLSVVYGIIKEHKGDIKVYSELGKGSSFTIYLPLIENLPEKNTNEKLDVPLTGNESIFLLDDEKTILKVFSKMLISLGYTVECHDSSTKAYEKFKNHTKDYDLIITDFSMPEMTGLEFSKKIKNIRPDIPILICTGYSEKIITEKNSNSFFEDILMKPPIKEEIASKIRKVLNDNKSYNPKENVIKEKISNASDKNISIENENNLKKVELPKDVVSRLNNAILRLHLDDIKTIINEIGSYDPELADKMKKHTSSFNFDKILDLIS